MITVITNFAHSWFRPITRMVAAKRDFQTLFRRKIKLLTVRLLRQSNGIVNGILLSNLSDSSKSNSTTTRERASPCHKLRVAQSNLHVVRLSGFQIFDDSTNVDCSKTKEGLSLYRVGAKVNCEFAIYEEISCACNSKADFPVTIFIRNEFCCILRINSGKYAKIK